MSRTAGTAILLAAMMFAAADSAPGQARRAGATPEATARITVVPCSAYLKVGGKQSQVTLVGSKPGYVIFVIGSSSIGQRKEMPVEKVESAFFQLKFEYAAVNKAVRERNWARAARALMPTLKPAFPFLNLRENNAIEPVLDLGTYMKRAADELALTAETEEQKTRAKEQYKAAFMVFNRVGKASWSSAGMVGRLKSYQILVSLEKPKTAGQLFEKLGEPMPGDRAYGLYWLVKAQMDVLNGKWRDAMQAAVNSLCFENKDVDTFPDALLVSARCYEELQEWHRARDVYYEVARIFPETDWHEAAVRRLHFIMDRGLTGEKEDAPIENVFFATHEDMNKKVEEFFEALAAGGSSIYEELEKQMGGDTSKEEDEEDALDLDVPDE